MKVFSKEISGKPALFILLFLLAVSITLFFFFFRTTSTTVPASSLLPSPTPFSSFDPAVNGLQYKTEKYTITHPDNWQPTVQTFMGGASTTIKPEGIAGNPMIVIEAYDTTKSVEQKQAMYLAEGCQKGTITVNNQEYSKLYCLFNQRKIDGQLIKGATQQQMVYIPKSDALYVVKFYYSSEQPQAEYEDIFVKMLSTLEITQ